MNTYMNVNKTIYMRKIIITFV